MTDQELSVLECKYKLFTDNFLIYNRHYAKLPDTMHPRDAMKAAALGAAKDLGYTPPTNQKSPRA
jgi:hypothetical protein